jgi:tRNA modification GTPase
VEDTITAISTPPGEGGIGIIRVSGPLAQHIAERCLRKPDSSVIDTIKERHVYFGKIIDINNELIDEVIYFLFRSPKSYTREDLLEIQMHGNAVLLQKGIETIIHYGARLAEPGEFTKRAFLNGRIDLTQAEAIIDLIRARTERSGRVAYQLLAGELSKRINKMKTQIINLLSEIEASLDYPEEEIDMTDRDERVEILNNIHRDLGHLIKNATIGRILRDGVNLVLVGRPNVGKSSLMNSFLQQDRVIVTEIPGTTRDAITERIDFKGFPMNIVDTAGIRATDHPVERMGIDRTIQWIEDADIILFLLDNSQEINDEDLDIAKRIQDKNRIIVINKTDIESKLDPLKLSEITDDQVVIYTSVLNKDGLQELEDAILQKLGLSNIEPDHEVLVTRVRQRQALERAYQGIAKVIEGIKTGLSEDLVAVELRVALQAMGELTGENVDEQLMENIFENYCLGK